MKSLQCLKHYPWENIIPHKQVLWYFIILRIPEAVKEKLLPTSLLLKRQLQVHLKNTIIPLHPQIQQPKKNSRKKNHNKKTTPTDFQDCTTEKGKEKQFATYLHHLFTLHALTLNKYVSRKNYINKNKIRNYAEPSIPFQRVFKNKIKSNRREKDLVHLELKAGTAEN